MTRATTFIASSLAGRRVGATRSARARALPMVVLTLVCALAAAGMARAQETFGIDSYITPFPKDDVYQIRLIGDSLAAGLHYTLSDSLGKDPRVRFHSKRLALQRLTSNNFDGEMSELRAEAYRDGLNVAVVLVGTWDRRNLRDANWERLAKGSDAWRKEYARRVDETMKTLKKANVAVYWVGLPPFRRSDADADVQMMNEVFRERAYLNGVRFIETYTSFVGEGGAYAAYGPDLTGKIKLLREQDGIHLTYTGNQKLAYYVERAIKRDLDAARRERSIPLDGDEKDQAAIRAVAEAAQRKEERSVVDWLTGGGTQSDPAQGDTLGQGFFGAGRGGEQTVDNSRINLTSIDPDGRKQIISVDIVRPAIPASVVALVTRKQREDKPAQMGDTLVDRIAGGLNIMSSVTPASQIASTAGRRMSPAQTPFFRVLVKGERLPPVSGRADDVSWPRPQPPPRQRLTRSQTPIPDEARPGRPVDFGADSEGGGIPLPGVNPFRPRA